AISTNRAAIAARMGSLPAKGPGGTEALAAFPPQQHLTQAVYSPARGKLNESHELIGLFLLCRRAWRATGRAGAGEILRRHRPAAGGRGEVLADGRGGAGHEYCGGESA